RGGEEKEEGRNPSSLKSFPLPLGKGKGIKGIGFIQHGEKSMITVVTNLSELAQRGYNYRLVNQRYGCLFPGEV
ncbi:MAG: hypothetical protein HY663_04280, partial [Chloroflexi bacterium]|nr:hypothetical protein [Chloroflexota bacterium]